ncbi:MAG: putative branched-chain amino acid transport ATP-binding protein LivG [Methanocella sp. PtaU1.Bin125]|nr:MAG: putative branched-chain amino acid transport ATP-binding protein LivG [Methanocella sp. PtaU1.Bin125]
METIIQTTNLTKFYGKNRGISDVNITVRKGDIFGFLGPNGAGKSTTIRTLLDFIRPTGGSATIFGLDCQKESLAIRRRVGYIPAEANLYGHMTGWKYLEYLGGIRGRYDPESAHKYAERFGIRLDRRMREYSSGMRQKVIIIQALMSDPDLVIMDEPTKGLDPLVQQTFMDVIREEAARGKTIFMSSHVLSEVEKVCNRVAIIRNGLIVAEEDMESLKRKSGKVIEVKFRGAKPEPFIVAGAGNVAKLDGYYKMTATGDIRSVLRDLAAFDVEDVNIHPMTLDDIFMQYYAAGGK